VFCGSAALKVEPPSSVRRLVSSAVFTDELLKSSTSRTVAARDARDAAEDDEDEQSGTLAIEPA
jgi:hypothetical protein